ncbi:MAG TPA: glycyl-radical enzyme activating protein [Anaeromyxobacteraceae bacterium]|nr:glycyl-radical enzyme activating protein [Anaeromyxobacteraceae bacterium]
MPEAEARPPEGRAAVLDVQRFSLHDGPGIRTVIFLKGCPLRCAWCQNPESQDGRPVLGFHRRRCGEHRRCEAVCERGAILPGRYRVDHARCDLCLKCVEACPTGALVLLGRTMTAAEVMEEAARDRDYHLASGGGVTVSGGEPALHPGFLLELLGLCRSQGVHSVVETCGCFSGSRGREALALADLVYFDLKLSDPLDHERRTGARNDVILDNARALVRAGLSVEFRIPLVEGFTDGEENLAGLAAILRSLGQARVHLVPYHGMGESKIDVIDGEQPRLGLPAYPAGRLDAVGAFLRSLGVEAVGGR